MSNLNVSAFGLSVGAGWKRPEDLRWADLRSSLETIIDITAVGLVVGIDEVHEASRSELHDFGNEFQHVTRAPDGPPPSTPT